ncbi:VHL beta domain-containing protein [Endothiovibrio diazotrophicus]
MKRLFLALVLLLPATARATELSCDQESGQRSNSSGGSASVTFQNDSSATVNVYWINFQGNRTLYKTLTAGASYRQPTYIGHPWVVTDESERCVYLWVPEQSSENVEITDATLTASNGSDAASSGDIETLFGLAESHYANWFPAGPSTTSAATWTYRHYPSTGIYLGVDEQSGVYLYGGPWGDQLIRIGTVSELLAQLQPTTGTTDPNAFSRPVATRTGVGTPAADLDFQEGQSVNFDWQAEEHLTVNGVRFDYQADGGTSWTYTHGSAPSLSSAIVYKSGMGSGTLSAGPISISIINNDNPLSPVFVTYTFE